MKTATLAAFFESRTLFATAIIEGSASFDDAQELLGRDLRLVVEADGIYVKSGDTILKTLSEFYEDEFGCWPEGADRSSVDDYFAARIGDDEFVRLLPRDSDMKLVWWAIDESKVDDHGKFVATTRRASGHIGIPEIDAQHSASTVHRG